MTDIDKFPCDRMDLIDDPESVVARAIATMLPAEFQEVTCFYQFSSSAGFRDGYAGIHLWWWLDRAFDSPTIKRWLKDKTRETQRGACKVDCSILSGNIPHFIADPIIVGGHDPLPRRTGYIERDAEEVSLPANIRTAEACAPINVEWSGPAELKRQHDKLKSALEFVPNDDVEREDWVKIGHAIKAQLGEAGRDLWLAWSKSSSKTGKSGKPDTAEQKWSGFQPSRITGEAIFRLARAAGWIWDDNAVPADHRLPAYYDAPTEPREKALERQNNAIRSAIGDGAMRALVSREIKRRRKEAREASEGWEELSRADKARISRAAKRAALAIFGMKQLPTSRHTLVTGAQGTGKTTTTASALADIRGDVAARVLVPTTAKAEEFATDYRAIAGADSLPVYVVHGRSAADVYGSGKTMCGRPSVVNKAVEKGINIRKTICGKCPLRPIPLVQSGCGYLQQEAEIEAMSGKGVFVGSHAYLFLAMPGPWPDVLVVDESVVLGAPDIMELSPDTLRDVVPFKGSGLAEVIAANRTVNAILDALQTPDPLGALSTAEVTREDVREAMKRLRDAHEETDAGISGAMSDEEILAAVKAIPDDLIGRALILLSALWREMGTGRRTLTGITFDPQREVMVDGRKELLPRLRVHRLRQPIGVSAQTALVVLDGTGSRPLNEALFGALEHVHTPVERNAHVTGTIGKNYSRQSITGMDRNGNEMTGKAEDARRLRREIATIAARQPGNVLVVSSLAAAEAIAETLPANARVPWHNDLPPHFGALRGLNTWEDCETAFIVGRESVSVETVEDIARCYMAWDTEPFVSFAGPIPEDWRTGWPFTATRGRRMRDGTVQPIEVEVHPDPRCQAVLEQIREAEILQAADRVRPVFNRRRVVLANNLVLDLTYDRVLSHAELTAGGGRFAQALSATGVLPLGPVDLHPAHRNLFPSENAARIALRRAGERGVISQIRSNLEFDPPFFSYRKAGQRGSQTRAIIDPRRHPDPRG